jgi:hypothetical protein
MYRVRQHTSPRTESTSIQEMGGLSGWRPSRQGDVNSALYESLVSGSYYALLQRLLTLFSLLPFPYLERCVKQDLWELLFCEIVCRKRPVPELKNRHFPSRSVIVERW